MFLVSSCNWVCPIHWCQVLSREWRCSWSSFNYTWVVNIFYCLQRSMLHQSFEYNQYGIDHVSSCIGKHRCNIHISLHISSSIVTVLGTLQSGDEADLANWINDILQIHEFVIQVIPNLPHRIKSYITHLPSIWTSTHMASSGSWSAIWRIYPDSKVHGANMGPIWGRQDPGGPHVGPMNFVIWVAIHVYLENSGPRPWTCRRER